MNEAKASPDLSFDIVIIKGDDRHFYSKILLLCQITTHSTIRLKKMDNHQAIWDSRYEKVLRGERTFVGEPWLENWLHLVPPGRCRRALDVGCGSGQNARFLLDQGFEVTAIDISEQALELCRREAPKARVAWADIREGLPFAGNCFELIVADLSLHYFPWDMTDAIVRDVLNRLVHSGLFAGRFNSTGDANFGAGTGKPVRGESNLLIVDGIEKRFFTQECFSKLFGPPWNMVALAEKTTCRFGARKVLWEVVATKCDGNSAEAASGCRSAFRRGNPESKDPA